MNFYWEGLSLGFSLIVAIGAQNTFVLRQGIKKEHTLAVAALCSLIDLVLIVAGTLGLGSLIASVPLFLKIVTFFGAAFVAYYGVKAFVRAFRPGSLDATMTEEKLTLKETITTVLTLSLLNPHVYLDTVLLVGGVSSRHPIPDRYFFTAGACSASIIWFFALSFGAGFLAPLFAKKITWRIFDSLIGVVMAIICVQLVRFGLQGIQ